MTKQPKRAKRSPRVTDAAHPAPAPAPSTAEAPAAARYRAHPMRAVDAARAPLSLSGLAPAGAFELALEAPAPRRTVTVQMRVEDKQLFDELQGWFRFRYGRKLHQWELLSVVLADALANPEGRFAGVGAS